MRKIEQTVVNTLIKNVALWTGGNAAVTLSSGNTTIETGREPHKLVVRLFGNVIAILNLETRNLAVNLSGHVARTTISRINALITGLTHDKRRIFQRNFKPYLGVGGDKSQAERLYSTGYYDVTLSDSLFL